MDCKKNIIWLASYPKSGNTWFRLFLTALNTEGDIDINKIDTNWVFSAKDTFETVLDLSSDYVTRLFEEKYQKEVYKFISNKRDKWLYTKIHDAFTFSKEDNLPLIPEESTKMAVYFVRNPLDVVLSLANHSNKSIEKTIEKYICNQNGFFGEKYRSSENQFMQPLGTWSMHVESWISRPNFPVHVMRYEDMLHQPFDTFKAATQAIGLEVTDTQIQKAIDVTQFDKLQQKEMATGFQEKAYVKSSFFFKGQAGRWKTELTEAQIEKIRAVNEPMMRAFGYWEEN